MSRQVIALDIYTVKGNKKPGYQDYPDKEKRESLDGSYPDPLMQPESLNKNTRDWLEMKA